MLERLGRFTYRRARLVLVITAVLLLGAGALGVGAFGKLKTGGFEPPGADSTLAQHIVDTGYGGHPDLIVEVTARDGGVDDAAVADAGRRLAAALDDDPGLTRVVSYWTGAPNLRSADGRSALVVATTTSAGDTSGGSDTTELDELPPAARAVVAEVGADGGPVTVRAGGEAMLPATISSEVGRSLAVAEAVAVPVTLLLLVLAFGSLVAALVPLAIGFAAIVVTFAELFVLGSLTDVSVFSINLTTALGLGLAIDYALLIVARHRELLHAGHDLGDAVAGTVRTAGRTILFSAATVAAALAVLLVFPMYFLRSFAYAGIGVVAVSALAALIVAPALLTVLGPRVDALRVPGVRGIQGAEAPLWGRLAAAVRRRPALTAVPVLAALLVAASPLLGITFGTPDERVLPASTDVRVVGDHLRGDYAAGGDRTIDVVVTGPGATAPLGDYAATLSRLDGVVRVDTPSGSWASGAAVPPSAAPAAGDPADRVRPGSSLLGVVTSHPAKSGAAQDLVRDVRAVDAPDGTTVLVGGTDAQLVDTKDAIADRIPLALAIVALTTFTLLFLFTGSVLQPLRALVLNGLSLAAAVGVCVWVFQDGHLSGLLGFTPLPMDTSMTILLLCIGFGLSMDYEVFVLSRIKELHDAGVPDADAVRLGLARTGRIVTTAAALLAVTFVAFLSGSVSFLQLFGLGAALAIVIDATLVRGILVPASMRLLGRWAWWAPAPLRRLHDRLGLSEAYEPAPGSAACGPASAHPGPAGAGQSAGDDGRPAPAAATR